MSIKVWKEKELMIKSRDLRKTVGLLIAATIIAYLFYIMSQTTTNIAIVYMLFVVLVSRYTTGYMWGVLASIAGVIAVNYFFTEPLMTIDFAKNGYPITFCGMLTISLITSTLTAHLKKLMKKSEERQQILEQLNQINSRLLAADSRQQIQKIAVNGISDFMGVGAGIWLKEEDESAVMQIYFKEEEEKFFIEREKRKEAFEGRICQQEENTYFPLSSHNKVWGVLGIANFISVKREEKKDFLKLVCSQVAIALERQELEEEHQKLETETAKEKMRSNLLRSISHDLRTPLTAIIGASQTCLENLNMEKEKREEMLEYIYEDSNWLLNMVENLLTITRIRQDGGCIIKSLEPIEEVIFDAILRLKKRYPKAKIELNMPEEILMVPMDPILIEQAVINLTENAVKHSNSIKPIQVRVVCENNVLQVSVRDFGKGIAKEELKNIFDGYCITKNNKSDANKGMGIGLSICKAIISAHGGRIEAYNHGEGAEFLFELPTEETIEKKREKL